MKMLVAFTVFTIIAVHACPQAVYAEWNFMELEPEMQVNQVRIKAHLRTLSRVLAVFRRRKGGYPDDWLDDLFTYPKRVGSGTDAPDAFEVDIQFAPATIESYRFRYTPKPNGCKKRKCTTYEISAIPFTDEPDLPGAISFFMDQSGIVRRCIGTSGADSSDNPAYEPPDPCLIPP